MEVSGWTIVALAVVVALNSLFIGGMCVALFLINKKLSEAVSQAEPLLIRATETLTRVEATTVRLQHKVDEVLDKATELVEQVSERVDTTTAIAEEAVTEPLIGAASLMAGINRGLRAYAERSHEKGDGRS